MVLITLFHSTIHIELFFVQLTIGRELDYSMSYKWKPLQATVPQTVIFIIPSEKPSEFLLGSFTDIERANPSNFR